MSEMLEKILSDDNIETAYKRVYANKGAGGVDEVTINELEEYMKEHWQGIKEEIRERKYKPQPVLRVEIPKPNGEKRKLGIPTVIDRVIEQAITQVLTPIFEPIFSESSYGFRPNRRCEQAIIKLLEYFNDGYVWIVDIDLEKFFDNVPQDKLMSYVGRVIHDGDTESLIRKYLKAGVMDKGRYETYKTVELTQKGISKAEKEYNIENYFDIQNYKIMNYVKQALISKEILKKDVDYIIWDDEIKLVDKFTGRIMEGKRFTGGLQQAIETKEKLQIKEKSKIIANMTIQNYFKMYKKLSGMTGTAKTSEKEFNVIYNLDVITVPENRKSKRIDRKDKIFRTKKEKYKKLVEEIRKSKEKRQPVLIGTATIKTSEELSKILKKENIKHNILNAKNNEKEAEIIKEAGNIGKITIATNMAGRGTNILLGGEKEKNKKEVIKAGGLKVIGTEKHESSRIDEQLRGRSGRQGEVGESIFLLSLEDELIRIYGNKKYINPKNKFIYAQKNVKNRNYTTRKRIVKYDEILDIQRKLIYDNRKKVLSNDIEKIIKGFISYYCDNVIKNLNEIDERIISNLEQQEKIIINENTIEIIKEKIYDKYCLKEKEQGDKIKEIVKKCLLKIIDENWIEHLEIMENIKSNMELRVYGGYDPIEEYKIEGRKEFDFMIYKIKMNFINEILFGKKYI